MKVSLVVASGTHQGKVVPIAGSEFLIGREGQCHLRPASQAISKKHCGILIRDGKVAIVDYRSTNGTLVNDVLIRDEAVEIEDGALVMVGPLDFHVRIEQDSTVKDGTPFPASGTDAMAAVKAVAAKAPVPPGRDSTPNPANKPVVKPTSTPGSKEALALTDSKIAAAAVKPGSAVKPAAKPEQSASKPAMPPLPSSKITASSSSDEDDDNIAAMLLGMDDGEDVPEGSTVMEMSAAFAQETQTGTNPAPKVDDKNSKKSTSREDMTNAANDILRKMRRSSRNRSR